MDRCRSAQWMLGMASIRELRNSGECRRCALLRHVLDLGKDRVYRQLCVRPVRRIAGLAFKA
jgi:hypothetical protein